ncbi:e3 ubiquitin-protein ligase rnf25 [Stylonychia lemnae]|uniref:E3 ubiquitin-protein ligase rnf25 n=1 Tax=Stylonychia lemnae TaxID=5949 RepID=A0A077ZTE8_STYLE|nr:e3 ubiquitin-protein ligase rnf25 [Stylonychia lemnae]|eukprot:CDW71736.1 e3 ubiquitin-protein ligase rnf25 [Stylonychia lemnae]
METTLLEKIEQELEIVESIYSDDGVIVTRAQESKSHGSDHVECLLKLQPNTGFNAQKIAVIVEARLTFQPSYPADPPTFEFSSVKGLDDEQIDQIVHKFTQELQGLSDQKKENSDDTGYIYDLHDKFREILTEFNDTVDGRCAVCLEKFCEDQTKLSIEKFTDRVDLVRVDQCFHRFHLICLYRDWYMTRVKEKDEFGCEIEYKPYEHKRCPICRRHVSQQELDYIKTLFSKHPEVENHAYKY